MLKIIKLIMAWAIANDKAFKKMLKKDIWMLVHPKVMRFSYKIKEFEETVFNSEDEQVIDILEDVFDRFSTEEEAAAEILVKYIEYKAKNGSVEAAKYIRFGNRHLGGLRNYCVEGVRAFEKLEDLVAEV